MEIAGLTNACACVCNISACHTRNTFFYFLEKSFT